MSRVYLEIIGMYIGGSIMIATLIAVVCFVFGFIRFLQIDENETDWDETKKKQQKMIKRVTFAGVLTLFIIVSGIIFVDSGSLSFKAGVQELKIKYGIENYNLVIKDIDDEIVFEKEGYFEYTKEYNQITIYDKVTKQTEIVTINDDMKINLNITEGAK